MERAKIAIILIILGYVISLFIGLGSWLIIFGIILMVFTRNDYTYLHKRCVLFSICFFIALLGITAMLIYHSPYSPDAEFIARFISSYGLILVLVTLVYGLETTMGRNLCFATIFSSFLAHGLLFVSYYAMNIFNFIAQILILIIYFIAYKNVATLKARIAKQEE
ncbi:MAG: hypothetical protein QMC98_00010 [Candidatus Thermoplasmatota archaeon]|nr:hypothetical protein [Candidatus Thermoplasmatota archaeon]